MLALGLPLAQPTDIPGEASARERRRSGPQFTPQIRAGRLSRAVPCAAVFDDWLALAEDPPEDGADTRMT